MLLQDLKNKKILILGFGREGKDTYVALKKLFPEKLKDGSIAIADQNKITKGKPLSKKVEILGKKDYLKRVGEYEVIIKTPGIPLARIKSFLKKGAEVTSQTKIFFDNFDGMVVGVAGTKGKGTVASLIYHILKKAGFKVHLVGNIGRPVFQKLLKAKPDEVFVYELSSHQLFDLKKSPQIVALTNLFVDHLDYYKNLAEYHRAKQSIVKFQTKNDFVVYNEKDAKIRLMAQTSKAEKRAVTGQNNGYKSHLRGDFNGLNVALAVETAKIFGVNKKDIQAGILAFKGLPHRLEFIGKYQGIEFYNDSMSTIPEVTVAALGAIKNTTTLMVGGSEKGSDYQELAKAILKSKVKNLIILGEGTGQNLWKEIEKIKTNNKIKKFIATSMKQAVEVAFQKTGRGETCLLSPGSASFNIFKNYRERGDLFKKWVRHYAQKKNTK